MTGPTPSPLRSDDPDRLLQALQDAQGLLTLAEESAGIGIWDRDVGSNLMRATPTFWRLMGLEPRSGPVSMEVVRAVRHPDDAARVVQGFEQAMGRGDDVYENEYRIIRPSDGQVRWIFGRGRLVRGRDGKPVRYSGVDIDVTERKQAEAHVRLLMHEVNHRAKNSLAIAASLLAIQGRRQPDPAVRALFEEAQDRLNAMARVHEALDEQQRSRLADMIEAGRGAFRPAAGDVLHEEEARKRERLHHHDERLHKPAFFLPGAALKIEPHGRDRAGHRRQPANHTASQADQH